MREFSSDKERLPILKRGLLRKELKNTPRVFAGYKSKNKVRKIVAFTISPADIRWRDPPTSIHHNSRIFSFKWSLYTWIEKIVDLNKNILLNQKISSQTRQARKTTCMHWRCLNTFSVVFSNVGPCINGVPNVSVLCLYSWSKLSNLDLASSIGRGWRRINLWRL